jgi:hypothetical protein
MVPSSVFVIDELPRLSNGKVDRTALSDMSRERPALVQAYESPRTPLERWLTEVFQEVLGVDRVGVMDPFFELGGDSILAARVTLAIQQRLGEFVFVVLLFEHPTVAGLAARLQRSYASAVAREFGEDVTPSATAECVTADDLTRASRLTQAFVPRGRGAAHRNPPAIFLLAPPRSGTTLLTAMLAGHPRIVAAAELNLLAFSTLGERRSVLSGARSLWREGAIRSLMDLEGLPVGDAQAEMHRAEEADDDVLTFFARLQRSAAPRLLLDKSPAYGLDARVLRRIEADFDRPIFLHLHRHPHDVIRSFVDHHMEQVYFNHHGFTPRQAAEIVWTLTHRNVLAFVGEVPADRVAEVSYEALVTAPERTMRTVMSTIGLGFDPGVLTPYENKDRKVPGGLYPDSKSMGDPKFHGFRTIVPNVHVPIGTDSELSAATMAVAERLGYRLPAAQASDPDPAGRAAGTRRALEARRLRRVSADRHTVQS